MRTLSAPNANSPTSTTPPSPRRWGRWGAKLVVTVLLLGLGWEGYRVIIGNNRHVVLPGKVYRSAQPDADSLRAAVNDYGLKSVFNLRGPCAGSPFYDEEAAACKDLGLTMLDFEFSAVRLPKVTEVRRLVQALETAEQPILLHCKRGSDRTGIAAVIAQVLVDDVPYQRARTQLGWRYAHFNLGPTRRNDEFFALYENWLTKSRRTHSRAALRHWLMEEYRGAALTYARESFEPLQAENKVGKPLGFRVRFRNTSDVAWEFKAHRSGGIHGVWEGHWDDKAQFGRAGNFTKTIEPGQSVEMTYVLPPFRTPGKHRVVFDLVEEGHAHFAQVGAEPYQQELLVRE